ncbi:MAG: digeranylgeranylglycerophospholipid reductase [Methanosarcina thermophila]|mgnify:FL=1|jgi:digeranylgeranylglycerophospholipid reductase|uniref:Digeranylgeranylglycerophospholipid reductase n=3 Tax=Methanosarcina thermophila TaxID=2210 RepID=A0A1I6Z5F0_METTE|nr:digeranylgeranylglycerophospholipid reductase [Methanosarcina thermophila]ALK06389.1 MAG: digeranylgeranylglycerophospholipid reductase [Methanosarcina sp. 795]AKB11975.1 Digeranylgeranylglycerophospholipid reductase [Methanosarcina thermophila TM-1]AKB14832.1 Digeranylgeranylglycerophospholipid reductase [Methanosarcina thermophila CHTI-55]NLU55973.1 NAD(P)/FAD-dependent oxidoreductase [Methanosarcina thermophila]SFT57936.1 2,3-di-O-geranylgeranylglyceryl phosphate reductase [Methanosarcin
MKDRYDVLVIGAGPAGSIAARNAAEKGLDVLLIEKRQEIGDPVRCAEGVNKECLKKHVEIDKRWICADLKASHIYSPDGTRIVMAEEISGGEVGYVLERKVFDRALAEQAARAGAEVRVKTRAIDLIIEDGFVRGAKLMHLGKTYDVRAKIVIGADGIESKVGRWAGIDTSLKPIDIETCAQYLIAGVDIAQDYCEFYVGNEIAPGGYIWIFPKGEGKANVGIGILGSRAGKFKPRPVDYLNSFVEKKFPNARIIEMVYGGVPVSGSIEKTSTNGLMLIGDAARQSDPITGGGILNAMEAGKLAGEAAYAAISSGDVSLQKLEEVYEKRWRATIGHDIDMSLIVKNCFINLSDDDLNSLARSLKDVKFERMSLLDLLQALFKANKKLLWDLRVLFKDAAKEVAKNKI